MVGVFPFYQSAKRVRIKHGAASLLLKTIEFTMIFTFRRSDIPRLDLDIDSGSNFKAWLEEWTTYHALSGLNKQDGETQFYVLRLAFLRDTATVINNLGLPDEVRKNYSGA